MLVLSQWKTRGKLIVEQASLSTCKAITNRITCPTRLPHHASSPADLELYRTLSDFMKISNFLAVEPNNRNSSPKFIGVRRQSYAGNTFQPSETHEHITWRRRRRQRQRRRRSVSGKYYINSMVMYCKSTSARSGLSVAIVVFNCGRQ